MQKPPLLLVFDDIDSVEFMRQVRAASLGPPLKGRARVVEHGKRGSGWWAVGVGMVGGMCAGDGAGNAVRVPSSPCQQPATNLPPITATHPPALLPRCYPQAAGATSAKTFDLAVRMRSGQDYLFRGIPR